MTDFSKYGATIAEQTAPIKDISISEQSTDFSKYGSNPMQAPATSIPKEKDKSQMSAFERFKMSFASKDTRSALKESEKGFMKGGIREMIGDVADVAGGSIPFALGTLGAAGGAVAGYGVGAIPGAAVGVTAGESIRGMIGQAMGVREDVKPVEEITTPIVEGVKTLIGGKIIQKGGGYILSRFPKLLGILTGKGDDIVESALKNPKAADEGLAKGDEALRTIVEQGKTKSVELRDSFNNAYQTAFSKISGVYGNRPMDKIPLFQKFTDLLKNQRVVFSREGVPDYATSKISANPGEVSKVNSAIEAMQKWDDWSLNGMIKLKQQIGALTKFPSEYGGASKSPVLGQMYHFIDEQIRQTLPKSARAKYDSLNGNYSKMINTFDDIVDAFNDKNAFARIANIFSKNRDELREIIKYYEQKTGISVSGTVAGRELGMGGTNTPAGIWNPSFWVNMLIDPKIQGKLITVPGRVNESIIKPVVQGAKDIIQAPGKTLDQFLTR